MDGWMNGQTDRQDSYYMNRHRYREINRWLMHTSIDREDK